MENEQRLDGFGLEIIKKSGLRYSLNLSERILLCSKISSVLNLIIIRFGLFYELVGALWRKCHNINSSVLMEMERDVLAAHGAAQMLKERTVDNSDIYTCYICDICGCESHKVPKKKNYICKPCQNTTKISKIVCPYAFMLFMKELKSMNILGRIRTSKSIDIPRG